MRFPVKIFLPLLLIFINFSNAFAIEDMEISINRMQNSIEVTTHIIPSKEFIDDFKEGLSKNLFILIEFYRKWSIIPDEFISGVQIQRIFISDPIKEEFIVKSIEGQILREKKFKNWQDALEWGLKINPVKVVEISNLQKGKYYVKVTVESNIKQLPSVLEHILFFIPKYEKKIIKESESFRLP
ncbi:MAG: DUF4390 domain-containing protein [Thermodesulfovibrio sp.]|uniref:DUF4390 domain-containing protein n=1 Tax=unclassified Thermodesulfovibrio TaxID=2645936 RepID=UPI00083B7CDA|nr:MULTISPECIES: DUF4390 domain-containing protein [unclassified Thermodesulfovibrio]MDI1472612.1 DUF4390 domain-containing protein [Thermodesulfovibrio sp. 1176]MDI6714341.1 DUF4390 domain-containing protein [Thermodesulfovibrio sp.]ODA44383.1 hypothetical protein THER_0856 [Thermodesulfovibrio sp. N1]